MFNIYNVRILLLLLLLFSLMLLDVTVSWIIFIANYMLKH